MTEIDVLRRRLGPTTRRLRLERGWTLAQLARHLDLSESRLSELERGAGSFAAEHLLTLFRLFHVGPEDFLGGDAALDPVVGSLVAALAKFGARHLAVDDTFVIRREHSRVVDAVQEVLLRHPSARLLTALPPVLVVSSGDRPLAAVQHAVVQAGVPGRWRWLLDHFVAALDAVGEGGSVTWRRDSARARTVVSHFLESLPRPAADAPFDLLDPDLRSARSVKAAEAAASAIDRRWRVLSRLDTPDFVGPLDTVRGAV